MVERDGQKKGYGFITFSTAADADTFMAMVERGYNVIYANSGWTFVEGQVQGQQAAQMLVVEDGEGRELKVIYFLRIYDGRWQITGVQPMA